jgi:general transcription factor 3C polypeptide 5 (transcription factor C subunit 1)
MKDFTIKFNKQEFFSVELPLHQTENDYSKIKDLVKVNFESQSVKLNYSRNHSINGLILDTNQIVLEYSIRTNKRTGEREELITCKGIVTKTARFRGIADYQYSTYDVQTREYSDPIEKYVKNMKDFNLDEIRKLPIDNRQNIPLVPPPRFAPLTWSYIYEYKENPNSIVVTKSNPQTGKEESLVLNNLKPTDILGLQIIGIDDNIPKEPLDLPILPSESISAPSTSKTQTLLLTKEYVEKLIPLFDQRPICTKYYLCEKLGISSTDKYLSRALSYITYYYQNGPWRFCHIKLGLDPRQDRKMRFYQTLEIRAGSGKTCILNDPTDDLVNSIQLCDIKLQDFHKMIQSLVYCRPVFDSKDGWYMEKHIDNIRKKVKDILKKQKKESTTLLSIKLDEEPEEESEMQVFLRQLQEEDGN